MVVLMVAGAPDVECYPGSLAATATRTAVREAESLASAGLGSIMDLVRNACFQRTIPMAIKPTQPETSPSTSTETRSKSADELWAEAWLAERAKPSRQRNLTPLQRQRLAETLRRSRNLPSDETWAVSQ
jgi:hypothetical protein